MTDSPFSFLRLCAVLAASSLTGATAGADPLLLLRGVDVVTLTGDGVLAGRDVLVDGATVAAIEPSGVLDEPAGATVVDGAGAFLVPGLIDAHVHLRKEESLADALAWGLTTIRSMEGAPELLVWRDEIAGGERLGPTVVCASPILHREADGAGRFIKVTTEAGARARVREYREAGYDLVKIAELDDGPFFALMEEARGLGVTVAGHTPNYELELRRVLAEGMASHEHLQELWELHEKQADDASPASFAALFRKAGAAVTPILAAEAINNRLFAERRAYLTPARLAALRAVGGESAVSRLEGAIEAIENGDWKRRRADLEETFAVLRALHEAGVTISAGTDSGGVLQPIGPGLHRELATYAAAGLPAEAVLRTATVGAARVLGLGDRGTVEIGKRADLLLVRANPLEDVTHLRKILGVVVAGRWLPESELAPRVAAPADADATSP